VHSSTVNSSVTIGQPLKSGVAHNDTIGLVQVGRFEENLCDKTAFRAANTNPNQLSDSSSSKG
jgi:hypothetical protein